MCNVERTARDKVAQERKKWEQQASDASNNLTGAGEPVTHSGIRLKRLYTCEDTADIDYLRDLGFPGEHPFTRGVYHTMYRGRPWTFRQMSGFEGGVESSERHKFLLNTGNTGLNTALDGPTNAGMDPDNPRARGHVGWGGTSICTLQDMEQLFEGVPMEKTNVSIVTDITALPMAAMYVALSEKRGLDPARLEGSLQNDPLKHYGGLGMAQYNAFPMKPAYKLALDLMEYATACLPRWTHVTVNGHCISEIGLSPDEEIAVVLANAKEYVKGLVGRGLNVDQFAPKIGFFVSTHHWDFFEQIAKYRALRRLWARMMREEFKAENPRSCALRIGVLNTGYALTAKWPLNNITRITLQVLAAAFGGCQSISTMAYDEPISLPTDDSCYTSASIQNIICYETGIADVADPLGGSYYLESLTDTLEGKISDWLNKIDKFGGVIGAIEDGFFERELNGKQKSLNRMREMDSGERIVVGVNAFVREQKTQVPAFHVDPQYEELRLQRLARFKEQRDPVEVEAGLKALEDDARNNRNVMPSLIRAVKQQSTLGEVVRVLQKQYGEYHYEGF